MLQTPQDLLIHALQEIQDAEMQASQALQAQLQQQAKNEELQQLLERRLQQGKQVLDAVSRGFEALGGQEQGEPNTAARGLIEQTARVIELAQTPEMKEAVLIAGVQKLEHYCIAAWGTVRSLATELGQQELAEAMQRALDEGYALDREFSNLAEGWVNPTAIEQAELAQGEEVEAAMEEGAEEGAATGGQAAASTDSADLKAREYQGKDGKVHHHTKEYMERNPE